MSAVKPALKIATFIMLIWGCLMGLTVLLADWSTAQEVRAMVLSALVCLAVALVCMLLSRGPSIRMKAKPMFLVTAVNWGLLCLTGALPLYLGWPELSFIDALFESVSGVTTTGSTILVGLDDGPRTLILWRSLTQWVGGIGIILMAVAVLPFLKVGGMRLFKTESSEWSNIQNTRVRTVATQIGVVYLLLTALAAAVYWALGMTGFNALNHALTSLATGGYSTSDSSFGQFDSSALVWAGSSFMLLGGLPFLLYVQSLHDRAWHIARDAQVQLLFKLVAAAALAMTVHRLLTGSSESFFHALTHAVFNITSVVTTTGYATEDYTLWGSFSLMLFVFLMFSGACSGSTSGGTKLFRFQLLGLLLREHLFKSLHPSGHFQRTYNHRPVGEGVLVASLAYLFVMLVSLLLFSIALTLTGLDVVTAGSAALTALMNVGPGFGQVIGPASNFSTLPDTAKAILCLAMLLGRLEYMALLILFTPAFWRW
ncbi:TrkH family potassium uptake protein [Saccharospirillum alexandrii]|uniref:TrkH family potassium uptake protein n=1 Tax=Saccharospirillum alexandrii TaxID=2448477 RepID=UPI003736E8D1